MSEANDLLDSLEDEENEDVVETLEEPHIVIGADRVIKVPAELKKIAVQFDHDIEKVTFDCPRYHDGIDMFDMNVYINYMRPDGNTGRYVVLNKRISDQDDKLMHFDWLISRHITEVKGNITFAVCIRNTDSNGYEINHWNSELNKEFVISEGLEVESAGIIEKYSDTIDALLTRMNDLEDIGLTTKIEVEEIENGHRVIFNTSAGQRVMDVMNGEPVTIVNTEYVGKDPEGGSIYKQTFSDGSSTRFTAPLAATVVEKSVEEAEELGLNPFLKYKIYSDSVLEHPVKMADLPKELHNYGIAAVGNTVYMFGGQSGGTYFNTILKHDLETDTITELTVTDTNEPRRDMIAVTVGSKIYLFGGIWRWLDRGEDYYDPSIRVFDTVTETMRFDPNDVILPTGITNLAAATVDGKIYLFGGATESEYSDKIYLYDPESMTLTKLAATLPEGKSDISAAAVGKKVYLFGGAVSGSGGSNSVLVFDTENMDLQTLSVTLPDQIRGASAVAIGTSIYLFGGLATGDVLVPNYIYKYDTETKLGDIIGYNEFSKNYANSTLKAVYISEDDRVYLCGTSDRANIDDTPVHTHYFDPSIKHDPGLVLYINAAPLKRIFPEADKYHPDYFTFQVVGYVYSELSQTAHIEYEINGKRYGFLINNKIPNPTLLEEKMVVRLFGPTKKIYMYDPDLTVEGLQGPKGDMPVKGVDYFTEEDKQEIVNSVLNLLPVAEGVEF